MRNRTYADMVPSADWLSASLRSSASSLAWASCLRASAKERRGVRSQGGRRLGVGVNVLL